MPRRIAVSTLDASTMDILNVVRQNASLEYQNLVPKVETEHDIPKVGEVLYGYPALANQFLNALLNRIALVRVRSLNFNNPYSHLKKGFLEYGETVEEIFVNIAKVRWFNVEKAADREFQRSLPDVKSAFHAMNYRVQYPVTIQDMDLRQAFLSLDGVQELIGRIVDSVYRAAEYDEYLMFKYMIIKGVAQGNLHPVVYDATDFNNTAVTFRSMSNLLTFPSTEYNEAGVLNSTPRGRQAIFMDARFNAKYDVDILASAFNMDKADFMGRLHLIDSFTTFDNDRWTTIQKETDAIPPVTQEDLAAMQDVRAVLLDEEWFQVYDNQQRFTEDYVAAGEYWNYFYNVWKTISHSPFSNALVILENAQPVTYTQTLTFTVASKDVSKDATVLNLSPDFNVNNWESSNYRFVQTEALTSAGIAVHPYGSIMFPSGTNGGILQLVMNGKIYSASTTVTSAAEQGSKITFTIDTGRTISSTCPLEGSSCTDTAKTKK